MGRSPHIAFLIGKPMARGSMIAGVVERLHHHWSTVTLHRPSKDSPLPDGILESDRIVQRGLGVEELSQIAKIEAAGVRCINRIPAAMACANRWTLMSRLRNGGIAIPETYLIDSWATVLEQTQGTPSVVKALDGELGRGAHVLLAPDGVLPSIKPFDGPFIVQEYLPGNPTVNKVYVAGSKMRGLVKKSLIVKELDDTYVVPFAVRDQLQEISARVGNVLSLDIFGVDYLDGPHGPTVIDVNPFPGFRGIPDASRIIAEHVVDIYRDIYRNQS